MKEEKVLLSYTDFASVDELGELDRALVAFAAESRLKAYAPYSNFLVGAALRLDDGSVVVGNNQENAAYPSGLCAERVALFAARANRPEQNIATLAIVTDTGQRSLPASPCGACRQVMVEFEANQPGSIRVLLASAHGRVLVIERASDLLPLCFTSEQLGL